MRVSAIETDEQIFLGLLIDLDFDFVFSREVSGLISIFIASHLILPIKKVRRYIKIPWELLNGMASFLDKGQGSLYLLPLKEHSSRGFIVRKTSLRSSRSQMFFKIGALKNFANFKGKRFCRSVFLIKVFEISDIFWPWNSC